MSLGAAMLAPAASAAGAAFQPAATTTGTRPDFRDKGTGLKTPLELTVPNRASIPLRSASSYPASVDLKQWAVPVGDQGSVDSCVAWTIGYAMAGWYANRTAKGGQPFAPMYMYSQIYVDGSKSGGGGAYFSDGYNKLVSQGIAPKSRYSGDDTTFRITPSTADRAAAAPYAANSYQTLFQSTNALGKTNAIKAALSSEKPVALGIPVFNEFYYLGYGGHDAVMTAAEATGADLGGHAIMAVGYNATGVQIQNSWGTWWGSDGYATLSWDFIEAKAREAYTLDAFADNTPVPGDDSDDPVAPSTFSVVGSTQQPATGNAKLELSTTGNLGANATEFRGAKYTALITSTGTTGVSTTRKVSPTYVSSTRLRLALPAGTGGTDATIQIVKNGVPAGSVTTSYLGKVTSVAWKPDPRNGTRTGTVSGTGLSRTQAWKLSSVGGNGQINLPTVMSQDALASAAGGGVFLEKDSRAFVKLPADVPGNPGSWRVSFAASSGAAFSPVSPATKLDVTYVAPKITRLSVSGASTAGGTSVTLTGTNLAAVDPDEAGSVLLRPTDSSTNGGQDVNVTTTSVKPLLIEFTVPALPAGQYRVVLRTGMGETGDSGRATDKIEAVTPAPSTSDTAAVVASGGKVVLTGTGFGSSAKEFSARRITAKAGKKSVTLKWFSDTTVQAAIPSGTPGQQADVILYRQGVPAPAVSITYGAAITGISKAVLPTSGGAVRLTGVGLSGTWTLHPVAEGAGTSRDVSLTPLQIDPQGTWATFAMPAATEGIYEVRFTGASRVFTSKSVISYSDVA
ncbi:C1 family peptidase [Kineosporia succinea]|uniref:Peptidase C1A papain C-terminal domain-containing protein n=1 Tax=Kineosporia succinea TaxID=84632 RepID=A0ABT9P2Y1_9ACTN|nr:C1 family peptidase [Kineosporia succinea]MDP9826575.1 hypothetical protein [Kineosporia succinea]